MKLLLLITNRKKSDLILKQIAPMHLLGSFSFFGKGTASHDILDALGLEDTDKDVVFMLVESNQVPIIFEILENKFNFTKSGTGIAVTIPLNGITSQTLDLLKKEIIEGEKKNGKY